MIAAELEREVVRLNYSYARCLDENRLEEWPEFFTDDCRYFIQPRDNRDHGLEGYWLYFENKRMLRDRVVSLKEVNIYQIHYERRMVSNVEVTGRDGDGWIARANFLVVHTDNEGRSKIFSAGEYRDRIVGSAGALRFRERAVIADTFAVPSHLSMPI
jgi:anthranilate 1,2-dioxygenase small subunit